MTDIREAILVRLLAIADGISGINTALRNTDSISDSKYPAILILDGDETVDEGNKPGRPSTVSVRVNMTPEIYILTTGASGAVGTTANAFRALVVKAILSDATLAGILSTNGSARYEGCATDLAMGRQMQGHCGLSFVFSYILDPTAL